LSEALYRKDGNEERFKGRSTAAAFVILFAFSVLLLRMFHLQVVLGHDLRRLSENNRIRLQTLDPPRGLILDRKGTVLARNRPAFDVYWTPGDVQNPLEVAAQLAAYMGVEPEVILERAEAALESRRPEAVRVAEDVDRDVVAVLEARAWELPGVRIQASSRRFYPLGPDVAHLVGYVGQVTKQDLAQARYANNRPGDLVGKFGVERMFQAELAGKPGGRQVEVDARGRMVSVLKEVPSLPGFTVRLSLDADLQKKACELMEGHSGAVVAVEPATGKVLALVSSPAFDPNWFVDGLDPDRWKSLLHDPLRPLQNKAVAGEYPPGSVYKIVTAMVALEEGVATARTIHHCPGFFR